MLNIIIVEGEGAVNNVKQRTTREVIVRIDDEAHKPVAGATVVFRLPEIGAGGVFRNGALVSIIKTDASGMAAGEIVPNRVAGRFLVRVFATADSVSATAVVEQTNASGGGAASAAGRVAGPGEWVHRLTGWAALRRSKHEAVGYGLYSYLLFASPPNEFMRPRYAEAIHFFLSQIPNIQSFSNDRKPSN